jgi:hypothetical protein
MKDYNIIEAATSSAVENEVRRLIVAGWKPLGGLAVVTRLEPHLEGQVIYAQAMTLDDGFR